jgi:hypothetical protein
MMGHRETHRDLAIVLFAETSAILARHTHRMHALLWKAGVADDPDFDRRLAFQGWQDEFAHLAQNRLIGPSALPNQVKQRLMLRGGARRGYDCRHWFNVFAFARQQQSRAIILQRPNPIRMTGASLNAFT